MKTYEPLDALQIQVVYEHEVPFSKNQILYARIVINGVPLVGYSYFVTDVEELYRSSLEPGEYFVITCHCGEPGCRGIDEGVQVTHEQDVIRWQVPQPGPAQTYTFASALYKREIADLLMRVKKAYAIYQKELENDELQFAPQVSSELLAQIPEHEA